MPSYHSSDQSRFDLPGWTIASQVLVVFVFLCLAFYYKPTNITGHFLAVVIATTVQMIFFTLLPTWIAWRLSGRKRRPTTIVFMAFVLLIGFITITNFLGTTFERERRELDMAIRNREMESVMDTAIQMGERGEFELLSELANEITHDMEQPPAGIFDESARLLGITMEQASEIADLQTQLDRKIAVMNSSGGVDPANIRDIEDLRSLGRALQETRALSAGLAQRIENRERELVTRFSEAGIGQGMIDEFIREYRRNRSTNDLSLRIIKGEIQIQDAMFAQLKILNDYWGKWHTDSTGTIVFHPQVPPTVPGTWNRTSTLIQTKSVEQAINNQTLAEQLAAQKKSMGL